MADIIVSKHNLNDKASDVGSLKKGYKQSNERSYFSGVCILSLSAIIVKIIGLIYKIPMLKLLGSEGMGYFNSAYEIYALFCVISTAGLPVAMSIMISSRAQNKDGISKRIFSSSMGLFCALGVFGTLVMSLGAHPISILLGSSNASFCMLAISPTVMMICIASAYRGYFQGLGNMVPTAISQVIESACKLIIGLLFAQIALNLGYPTQIVAAFAVLGLTLGTAISLIYLFIAKKHHENKTPMLGSEINSSRRIYATLLKIAIPITLSSAISSIVKIIDMSMILRRMQQIGFDDKYVFSVYGSYTTLAIPLFSLAPTLISSVVLPLIPRLSSAITAKDKKEQIKCVNTSIRLTCVISMPMSIGLCFFANEILDILFSGEVEAIKVASPLLSILAIAVPLSCLMTVGNGILQAYSKQNIPIISMAVGALIKIVSAFFIIGSKHINIVGAPISTILCDMAINVVNFYYINKCVPKTVGIRKNMLYPFLSAAISVSCSRIIYNFLDVLPCDDTVITIIAIAISTVIYIPMCFITGAIGAEDIEVIPVVNKLVRNKINKKQGC